MLAQDGSAECDQPDKNPLKYFTMVGNWTWAIGKTNRFICSSTELSQLFIIDMNTDIIFITSSIAYKVQESSLNGLGKIKC